MNSNGIINGVGDNKFAPKNTTSAEEAVGHANATREQAIIIATRMIKNLKWFEETANFVCKIKIGCSYYHPFVFENGWAFNSIN